MTGELIHIDRGRVTWNGAVGHVATALSPLGAGANIVANIGACVVEIKRFKALLAAQEYVATEIIRARQATIIGIFETERRNSTQVRVDREGLSVGYHRMLDMAINMHISEEQRISAMNIIPILSGQIVQLQISSGNQLIQLSETLRLGDTDAAISAWRQLDS